MSTRVSIHHPWRKSTRDVGVEVRMMKERGEASLAKGLARITPLAENRCRK